VQTMAGFTRTVATHDDYDIRHGRTYMYFQRETVVSLRLRLSYTTFAYANLRTSARHPASEPVRLRLQVDIRKNRKPRRRRKVVPAICETP